MKVSDSIWGALATAMLAGILATSSPASGAVPTALSSTDEVSPPDYTSESTPTDEWTPLPAPEEMMVVTDPEIADDSDYDAGVGIETSVGAGGLSCFLKATSPHYSNGAGGVIGKLKYSCAGTMNGVLVADAWLYRKVPGAVGPFAPKATNFSDYEQVGPGDKLAFWVPAKGESGIACRLDRHYWSVWSVDLMIDGVLMDTANLSSPIGPSANGCP